MKIVYVQENNVESNISQLQIQKAITNPIPFFDEFITNKLLLLAVRRTVLSVMMMMIIMIIIIIYSRSGQDTVFIVFQN